MTQAEAIKELIAKVEAGEWPGGIDGAARQVLPYKSSSFDDHGLLAAEAFDGSFDAAKALHEALLPGWRVEEIHQKYAHQKFGSWYVCLERRADLAIVPVINDIPARAWLLAILKAKLAELEQ